MAVSAQSIFESKIFAAVFTGLGAVIVMIGLARVDGYAPPPSLPDDVASQTRELKVEDAALGSVIVRDAKTGENILTYGMGEASFFRATLRTLVNDRRHKSASIDGNFRLETHLGNQLFLIDEVTGKTLSMNAFGPVNTAVFSALMSNHNKGEGL